VPEPNKPTELLGSVFYCCVAALLLIILSQRPARAQQMLLPTTELAIGAHRIHAEIAATDESRSYGLMNRTHLPPDQGMLFVFEQPGIQCFWMKNTPLPLSIAFIDERGLILNIADMRPQTTESHCPAGPALYALEMERGWFAQRRISAGQTLSGLPRP